jgi:hypothetical protein
MLYAGRRTEAIERLEGLVVEHNEVAERVERVSVSLHDTRLEAVGAIERLECFVNSVANTPKELQKDVDDCVKQLERFNRNMVESLNIEVLEAHVMGGRTWGAGVSAGAGVALMGPGAAMAIATTFGTASTGTAIASLSGAAATNAALAWLGGGALAAGGGGMVAGSAFLALAGPVGLGLGALATVGSAAYIGHANLSAANEADRLSCDVATELAQLEGAELEITRRREQTLGLHRQIAEELDALENAPRDCNRMTTEQLERLRTAIGHGMSLSASINTTIDL